MATIKCGWCGTSGHASEMGPGIRPAYRAGLPYHLPTIQSAFTCDNCDRLVIGSYFGIEYPGFSTDEVIGPDDIEEFWRRNPPTKWSPEYVQGQQYADVPEHIASAAGEAHKNASVGSNMSAILMARTVLEATAKDKDVTSGSLYQKIDALAEKELIRRSTQSAAHVIRDFGNDMAHGDISKLVDPEDAEALLTLMDLVLHEIYQMTATTDALKAKFAARKKPEDRQN